MELKQASITSVAKKTSLMTPLNLLRTQLLSYKL